VGVVIKTDDRWTIAGIVESTTKNLSARLLSEFPDLLVETAEEVDEPEAWTP